MCRPAVFLDVDGVLLDPARTPAEWVRLMGDVLAPALGGVPADWGRANAEAFPRVFADRSRWYDPDPLTAERNLATRLTRELCRIVGVAFPGDDAASDIGRRMDVYVCARADCAFPDTVATIRELAASCDLHTATGNPSWRVEALLAQWGVRELFGVPAGPDLARVMKDSAEFHPRVFALAGVVPERAIVVDDAPEHLARARAAGARTVLVAAESGVRSGAADQADAIVQSVADVPAAIRELG